MSRPEVAPEEVVQLVMHGVLYPQLAHWLEAHGFTLVEVDEVELQATGLRTILVLGPERAALLGSDRPQGL